jgi:hypothetical protein
VAAGVETPAKKPSQVMSEEYMEQIRANSPVFLFGTDADFHLEIRLHSKWHQSSRC